MLSIFPLLAYHGILSILISVTFAKLCNPANFICSGRCPELPPKIQLSTGGAVCMKDLDTNACVCWRKEEPNHVHTWFRCEAMVNGSVAEISCWPPSECFPPDDEPTCLIITKCSCLLMGDIDSPEFRFGSWRPVKALVGTPEQSAKYPKEAQREFSLKHLLFLLGFVIAPLACWCLLNVINENKCLRKNADDRENSIRHAERYPDVSVRLVIQNSTLIANARSTQLSMRSVLCFPFPRSGRKLDSIINKDESPPTYDEVVSHDPDVEESPPPSYADAVQGRELQIQEAMQAMIATQ